MSGIKTKPEMDRPHDVVVFLRGLNTWGDDDVHLGPLKLGPMHRGFESEFEKLGFEFISVPDMKMGSTVEMTLRALHFLEHQDLWRDPKRRIHLVGHSMGGLIARCLAHLIGNARKIETIVSVGSPHRGTPVAEWASTFLKNNPRQSWLLRQIGYDLKVKSEYFSQLTADSLKQFNENYVDLPGVHYASVGGACAPQKRSALFRRTRALLPDKADGLVPLESQLWGYPIGVYELDHFGLLGYSLTLSNAKRATDRRLFSKMVESISGYIRHTDSPSNFLSTNPKPLHT